MDLETRLMEVTWPEPSQLTPDQPQGSPDQLEGVGERDLACLAMTAASSFAADVAAEERRRREDMAAIVMRTERMLVRWDLVSIIAAMVIFVGGGALSLSLGERERDREGGRGRAFW